MVVQMREVWCCCEVSSAKARQLRCRKSPCHVRRVLGNTPRLEAASEITDGLRVLFNARQHKCGTAHVSFPTTDTPHVGSAFIPKQHCHRASC